jgi:hypothetical protein
VQAVEGNAGHTALDRRVLVGLWLLAYSEGVGSAREISRRTSCQPVYQWLTGVNEVNCDTLADFRVNYKQRLDQLFADVLGVLTWKELITLERVMRDGTKIRAVVSRRSFRREITLDDYVRWASQHVKDMGDPLQEVQSTQAAGQSAGASATGDRRTIGGGTGGTQYDSRERR